MAQKSWHTISSASVIRLSSRSIPYDIHDNIILTSEPSHMLTITPDPEKMPRFTHMIQCSLLELAAAGLVIADKAGSGEFLHQVRV